MPKQTEQKKLPFKQIATTLFALVLVWMTLQLFQDNPATQTVPYSAFKSQIEDGTIKQVTLDETIIVGTLEGGVTGEATQLRAVLPVQNDPGLFPLLEAQGVTITAVNSAGGSVFVFLLPWLFIIIFYIWLFRRTKTSMPGLPGGPISRTPCGT